MFVDYQYVITEQPGAAPGAEWLYEIPVEHHHTTVSCAVCGTASTRDECERMAKAAIEHLIAQKWGSH